MEHNIPNTKLFSRHRDVRQIDSPECSLSHLCGESLVEGFESRFDLRAKQNVIVIVVKPVVVIVVIKDKLSAWKMRRMKNEKKTAIMMLLMVVVVVVRRLNVVFPLPHPTQ